MIELYHGSTEIIRKPTFGMGRVHNDYGRGFYCTESKDLANEWACSSINDGICNHYQLEDKHLKILNLNTEEYSILNWMAILVANRIFRTDAPIAGRAKRYLEEHFMVNVSAYDVIIGYRADDKYYDFANAFLSNTITVEQLARAMRLGTLGEQVVLKSKFAFENIEFKGYSVADKEVYFPKRDKRNEEAGCGFDRICKEAADGLFMIDIMRAELRNDDPRIPRNIPE